jgi:hypothetical protein
MMKGFLLGCAGCCVTLLLTDCATVPRLAKTVADCSNVERCRVEGLLEMWSDGHGYIGIVTLDDGSCINVSLPERRSRSLLGQPSQRVVLTGRVVFFPYEPGVLSFRVNGRRVGYGRCAPYFVFVK